jgi:hypothetical protein
MNGARNFEASVIKATPSATRGSNERNKQNGLEDSF